MTGLDYFVQEATPVTISMVLDCLHTKIEVLELNGDFINAGVHQTVLELLIDTLQKHANEHGH